MGRSKGEVVGLIIGSVVLGLKQLCVFGCFFGWELWRCMVSISDTTLVALVEGSFSPVFSSSSSTTRGSSESGCKRCFPSRGPELMSPAVDEPEQRQSACYRWHKSVEGGHTACLNEPFTEGDSDTFIVGGDRVPACRNKTKLSNSLFQFLYRTLPLRDL